MIIVMAPGHSEGEFQAVVDRIQSLGYRAHVIRGVERTVIGAVGHEDKSPLFAVEQMPGVEAAIPILKPFKLASAEWKKQRTVIDVGGVTIGGPEIVIIAGPGVVEDEEPMLQTARAAQAAGAKIFRACVFSRYMSPYASESFTSERIDGIRRVREATGLKIISEVFALDDVETVAEFADVVQVGARNCQNFVLLRAVGKLRKPVFLERGMSTTIREFLMAGEYVMSEGNSDVILCERGIRTFDEREMHFALDLNAVPVIRGQSHLPIFVDPSHGTGKRPLVAPMARAAIAAGCDGLMIEMHPNPDYAMLDGPQSVWPGELAALIKDLRRVAAAVDRQI
jgi:3-deoxy-7-phosphoheptulonate synthase